MDWPGNYVYVPMWLLLLLVFLASGALQYGLVAAVRLVVRVTREAPPAPAAAPANLHVVSPAEFERERQHHS